MKNLIRRWLGLPTLERPVPYAEDVLNRTSHADGLSMRDTLTHRKDVVRFTLYKVSNGHVLEVGNYKPNPHGPDWTFDHHLVTDDTPLLEAVTKALTINSLER